MDYKRIIKSRKIRIKIVQALSFIPDKTMVKLQYRIKTGRFLSLKNPQRYTEKLQWMKVFYRNSLMAKCVDKYTVRAYIKHKNLEEILVPLIGVYKKVDDIDFDALPNQFVIKDTLGGGGVSVLIVNDKSKLDIQDTKSILKNWLQPKIGKHPGREWVYDYKRSRILIEELIDSNIESGGLIDYKFFCFDGKVKYVYGIADRELGEGVGLGIYNRDFELLPYIRKDERPLRRQIDKPDNYEDMIRIAETIGEDFPHARVDLYNQEGRIYFGEITFFDGSGYMSFEPDDFDYILGQEFVLPPKNFG